MTDQTAIYKDILGQDLRVGDRVAIACATGHFARLVLGTITETYLQRGTQHPLVSIMTDGKRKTYRGGEYVIRLPEPPRGG